MKTAALEAMGSPPGAIVGLQHQYVQAVASGQGSAAEAPEAAAHNDQIRMLLGFQGRSFALPFSVQPGARGRAIRSHAVGCRVRERSWWLAPTASAQSPRP